MELLFWSVVAALLVIPSVGESHLRIIVHYETQNIEEQDVFIRGNNVLGLSWDHGIELAQINRSGWKFICGI